MADESGHRTIAWGDVFRLDLPRSWTWIDEDEVISVFREAQGVGVLQISLAARSRPGVPNESEARELAESFADQRGWDLADGSVQIAQISGCPASAIEFIESGDESSFWQVWNIVGRDRSAFLTYTCDPDDVTLEAAERDQIIRSFRWL